MDLPEGTEGHDNLELSGDEAPTLVELLKDQARLRKVLDPEGLFTSVN